jgi:hypothetical protein
VGELPGAHFPEGANGNVRASRLHKKSLERKRPPGVFRLSVSFPEKIQHAARLFDESNLLDAVALTAQC